VVRPLYQKEKAFPFGGGEGGIRSWGERGGAARINYLGKERKKQVTLRLEEEKKGEKQAKEKGEGEIYCFFNERRVQLSIFQSKGGEGTEKKKGRVPHFMPEGRKKEKKPHP